MFVSQCMHLATVVRWCRLIDVHPKKFALVDPRFAKPL
jgi:hypothetical protein